jgi:hypothetical protein
MLRVGRRWLGVAYWIALIGGGAIVPIGLMAIPLPPIDGWQVLLLPVTVVALIAVAYRSSPERRLEILRFVSTAAGLCIGAAVLLRLSVLLPRVHVPVFSPGRFGLDGGDAYDAALDEIFCDTWAALAILYLGLRYVLRSVFRYARKSARIDTGK